MCGIVGYIGKPCKLDFLLEKLKILEYRGYDSSGIAFLNNNSIQCYKQVGKIENLKKSIDINKTSPCMIAHTRWATHGSPSLKNAHPYVSLDKTWAIVHNGIIENYLKLKSELNNKDKIESETDSCVIAELLSQNNVKTISEFIKTINLLKGSFSLACINKNNNGIFLAKNRSPLYCGYYNNNILIASDPICFINLCKNYFSFNDNEFAYIHDNKISFYDKNGNIINKKTRKMGDFSVLCEKKYPHYMIKEIYDEEIALKNLVNIYKKNKILTKLDKIANFKSVEIIGCGTAYHSGLIGAKYFEQILKVPAKCSLASEFIYSKPNISKENLYIFVSQSGETADTLKALEKVKNKGCKTLSITNVEYSSLATKTFISLPVCAGKEIAVASTKSYVCQLAVFYIIACYLKDKQYKKKTNYFQHIISISNKILSFNKEELKNLSNILYNKEDITLIGKNFDYITCLETALKFKEACYINVSAYPAGELKHGYLALIKKNSVVFVLATDNFSKNKTIIAGDEAKSRGAKLLKVFTENDNIKNNIYSIKVKKSKVTFLQPLLTIAPLQYLAYLISIKKGINPDTPRNLAKSVTVE